MADEFDTVEDDEQFEDESFEETPEAPEVDPDDDKPMTRKEHRELMALLESQKSATKDAIDAAVKSVLGETQKPAPRETFDETEPTNIGLANRQFSLIAEQMVEEAITDPATPKEVINGLKEAIYGVESLEALKDLRKQGRHVAYVDSKLMGLMKENKYTPPQYRKSAPSSAAAGSRGAGSPNARPGKGSRPDWMPKDQPGRNFEGQAEMELAIIRELGYDISDDGKEYLRTGGTALRK
jgi:hypothetical protein